MNTKHKYSFTQQFNFETFGQMMIFLRGQRGLSQKQLADLIKTKQASIARWEGSKKPPSLSAQLKIANALGLHMEAPTFGSLEKKRKDVEQKKKNLNQSMLK